MNLQPLRTKSKEAPRMRERRKSEENNQPLLGWEETKEMIQKQMMKDERKIKTRNSKKTIDFRGEVVRRYQLE